MAIIFNLFVFRNVTKPTGNKEMDDIAKVKGELLEEKLNAIANVVRKHTTAEQIEVEYWNDGVEILPHNLPPHALDLITKVIVEYID